MYYPRVEIFFIKHHIHFESNVILVRGDGIEHPNDHLDGQDINHPWLPDNGMGPSTMKAIKMAEWNVG